MTESTAVAIPTQEKWRREVESYEKQRYNVLVPREIGEIPPFHIPHMSIVQVSTDKDAGETYPLPGGKYGLSKVVLDRIAQAGSITWIPDACKSGWRTPRKYHYFAVGVVKGLDAVRRTIVGEKEIDLDVVDEELRQNLVKRWDRMERRPQVPFEQWLKNTFAEESLQFKKHVAARTESGAKNRAIRSAYGLKSSYSAEELKHPFVIPRVVPSFDLSDPDVKRLVLADALGVIPELYGKPLEQKQLPAALPEAPDDEPTFPETTGADHQILDAQIETTKTQPTDPAADGARPLEDLNLADEATFTEASEGESQAETPAAKKACVDQQLEALRRILKRKGYVQTATSWALNGKPLTEPLEAFAPEKRLAFLAHLLKLPDMAPKPETKPATWKEGLF